MSIYSSCFEFPEAAVNLQRNALDNRKNMKRLFGGDAYRPHWFRCNKINPK
ncbi:MAG: hypothetical protein LBJ00_09680 [Planctomycetaceae bacterium]|nr:hypothetical protein [Planctomycetaceae bacterium]